MLIVGARARVTPLSLPFRGGLLCPLQQLTRTLSCLRGVRPLLGRVGVADKRAWCSAPTYYLKTSSRLTSSIRPERLLSLLFYVPLVLVYLPSSTCKARAAARRWAKQCALTAGLCLWEAGSHDRVAPAQIGRPPSARQAEQ